MKRLPAILALGFMILAGLYLAPADGRGWEDASRKEIGQYGETFKVTGSSVAGAALLSATVLRADGSYFNNSPFVIWVGTTSATTHNGTHENQRIGFPILSSATFTLDGGFTGAWYFTCNQGVSACEVRGIEGKSNQ